MQAQLNEFTKGRCMEMCPEKEINMRERERLLHILEMLPGTEKHRFPKADRNRIVKSFQRSAAGKSAANEEELRPPRVLLKTLSYLLVRAIDEDHLPWYAVYDFITDRLMSIRQDLVIQDVSKSESVALLQPIVRFHAYSAYRLCTEKISNFDPVLNKNHIQECLKKLLCIYDAYDQLIESSRDVHTKQEHRQVAISTRPEFEALYLLLNLGNEQSLARTLQILPIYKTDVVEEAFNVSLNYRCRNFIRTCRLLKKLPTLLMLVASLQLPEIRRRALETMSVAYSSKNLSFPVNTLRKILLYKSNDEVISDCKYYGIDMCGDSICFLKTSFAKDKKALPPRHEGFIEDQLKDHTAQSLILV